MIQISDPIELKKQMRPLGSIGFVPTMGALHDGHFSLIKKSLQENEKTVVSIFLNATQFNNKEDLEKYPTSFKDDLKKLEELNVDYLFAPEFIDMYPDNYRYRVSEDKFSKTLCGSSRMGHFDGVLTVVLKLFNLVQPNKAYFGEKDYQQLSLIQDMAKAFFLDVEIVPCPIVRTKEGLALSSRNKRLSNEGLLKAQRFAKILQESKELTEAQKKLQEEGIKIDYLEEIGSRRFAAVEIENIRLIDNVEK